MTRSWDEIVEKLKLADFGAELGEFLFG